jgi:hypothetical protein
VVEIVSLENLSHCNISIGKGKTVLGFHWTPRAPHCDFVLVSSAGVDFYKFNEKSCKMSHVKGFSNKIGHYWLEPKDGVILTALSPPKLGKI